MHKFYRLFLGLFLLLFILTACNSTILEREYLEDIHVPLENHDGTIIIREWNFLQGSGAEIYYQEGNNTKFLGKCSGADDGVCPFQAGLYMLEENGDEITIRWFFNRVDHKEIWHSETF